MRETLKTIAEFRNESLDPREPGQAAAISARETLENVKLFLQEDATASDRKGPADPAK
jgi:hypothetical protein